MARHARVVKLVYTYALGAYAFRRAGSSPVSRTIERPPITRGFSCVIGFQSQGLFIFGLNHTGEQAYHSMPELKIVLLVWPNFVFMEIARNADSIMWFTLSHQMTFPAYFALENIPSGGTAHLSSPPFRYLSASSIAAVRVCLLWSTWPITPILTWGFTGFSSGVAGAAAMGLVGPKDRTILPLIVLLRRLTVGLFTCVVPFGDNRITNLSSNILS